MNYLLTLRIIKHFFVLIMILLNYNVMKIKILLFTVVSFLFASNVIFSQNITGSGTNNYVLKFTSTGSTAGNATLLFDNATSVGIGTTSPSANTLLHTYASGAKTAAYSGNYLQNIATSSTSSINKSGLEISSTGTWNGTSAKNIGLYISSVTGGTYNYDAIFNGGGNVGIGTLSPTALFHTVASGAKTTSYSGNLLTNTATSSTASINKSGLEITSTGTWNGTSSNNIGLYISSVTGGTNNYDAIFNGGGSVGIGTNSPTNLLSLKGNYASIDIHANSGTNAYISGTINTTTYSYFGTVGVAGGFISGSIIGDLAIRSYNKNILFSTDNGSSSQLYLKYGGNVGINTASPSEKLEVNGNIRTSSLTGTGTRMVQATSNGNLTPMTAGTSSQVLLGTGVWGNVPAGGGNWSITGNSGASYPFLGTTDNYPLSIGANSGQSMRINPSGTIELGLAWGQKVSIGYGGIATSEQLQINGNAIFAEQGFFPNIAPLIKGKHTYSIETSPEYTWNGDDSTGIFHPAIGIMAFANRGVESMRIIKDKGVCIGTTVAKAFLTVEVPTTSMGSQAATFSCSNSNVFIVPKLDSLSFDSLSIEGDQGIFWSDNSTNSNINSGLVIAPYSNKYNGLRITSDGNVGIGTPLTSNPNNHKLAVNGNIGAKEVFVEITSTTWPDYVFDKKYNLLPLNEVESYINKNSHLPDVPSAGEINEKGIAVGEMNSVLLKKIEELTLYMIEQNKIINNQQLEIIEFKERISVLETKVKQ